MRTYQWALLAAIVLWGTWVRARAINESLWLDELHTAWAAAEGLLEIPSRALFGNQSPLYPGLVWMVTNCLGPSEFSIRLISLVSGIALIVTGFVIGKRWSQSIELGLLVALLIAVDPHSIYFAQEARPYAMVQWLALLQVACFAGLCERPSLGQRMALIGLSCALFYLHYTSLLLIAGELAYLGVAYVCRWCRLRQNILPRIVDFAAVVVGTAPAWGHLLQIAARRDNWSRFVAQQPFSHVFTVFRLDVFVAIPLILCSVFAVIAWMRGRTGALPAERVRKAVLTGCCLAIPLLLAWCATDWDWFRLFFRRYLMSVAALPMLLAGLLGSLLPSVKARWSYVVCVAASALFLLPMRPVLINGVAHWHTQEDWRSAVGFVNQQTEVTHWPVFLRAGLIEDDQLRTDSATVELRAYCLLPLESLYRLQSRTGPVEPLPSTESWQLTASQRAEIGAAGGAWMVVRGSEATANRIASQLIDWLRRHGDAGAQISCYPFGHVSVLRISTP